MIIVCPSDEELLAVASGEAPSSDLQSHLQECDRCIRKVDGLRLEVKELQKVFVSTQQDAIPSPMPSISGTVPSQPQTTSAEPKVIGKYLVIGTLGGGGQASVYRAVHPTLDEQVVLKLSSRKLDDGDSADNDRLIAEGRILCQLKHPNIGRVYDMDFFERRPFLVMEYVPGRSLDQYVRDRNLTWPQIGALVAKVARTLGAAHRLGIVHQDVKPQNIVMDENDEPKLIDFGMARLNGAWSDGRFQPLGGTINYMAPEQARSDTPRITGRSDTFALGAVLYFLVTGKAPFTGSTREESLAKASNCQFDRESLEKVQAPLRLKQIALKAMSALPEDRFASAEEMAQALESSDRARRQRRWLVRAVPVVLVLAGIWAAWWWLRPVPTPPSGQLLITPDGSSSLDGNLPLVTGEKLKIEGRVPRDSPTLLFWISGAGGKVFRMPVTQVHGSDQFDHVFSPDRNRATALSGRAGTEFLLMVSGRHLDNPQTADALQAQLQSFFADHALAELPPTGAVLVDSTGIQAKFLDGGLRSRDPGGETADSCAGVSSPLDDLGKQLKDHGYYFSGIAVAHEDPPG